MSVAIFAKKMFGSSLSSVVCRMTHVLLVRSYVFTFLILSGEILYDFGIQAMFGSSLPPVVCGGLISYLCYLSNTSWLYKQHGRLIIRGRNYLPFVSTWVHPGCWYGSVLLIFLVFCVVLCFGVLFIFILCVVCPMLPVSLDCPFLIAPSVSLMFIELIKCRCPIFNFFNSSYRCSLSMKVDFSQFGQSWRFVLNWRF